MDDDLINIKGPEITSKRVLNWNIGCTNSINLYDPRYQSIIADTLDLAIDILTPIYGNKAMNNLLITNPYDRNASVNVFTTDGINSLKAIEFDSPIQKYIINILIYIGEHVDRKAHDGTTTALLFSAYLLRDMFSYLFDYADSGRNKQYCSALYADKIVEFFTDAKEQFEKKYTIHDFSKDELHDLLKITVKSHPTIPDVLCDIIYGMPDSMIEFLHHKTSPIETDEEITVECDKYDYYMTTLNFNSNFFNDVLHTKFKGIVNVLLWTNNINPYTTDAEVEIIKHMATAAEPLLIIAPADQYINADRIINEYTFDRETNEQVINMGNIMLCAYTSPIDTLKSSTLEFDVMKAMTDTRSIPVDTAVTADYNEYVFKAEVVCSDRDIQFFNMYPKEGYLHAYFHDQDNHPVYKKYYTEITEAHERILMSNNSVDIKRNEPMLRYLKRAMTAYSIPRIILGGRQHDVIANIDIIEDAKGVAASAIKSGIVYDGLYKLIAKAELLDSNALVLSIISAIKNMYMILVESNKMDFDRSNDFVCNEDCIGIKDSFYDMVNMDDSKKPRVIQSAAIYQELFSCIIEIFPRLIKTARIIVPNSVVLKNDGGK